MIVVIELLLKFRFWRIEEEIRIRDEELRKLEEERLVREQEEIKAREKEAQELELKRYSFKIYDFVTSLKE